MILFIEDGDGLLLQRQSDNMNLIASLLGLTDGFLGSLLDIRIFITTNAKRLDMDRALLRPGRLNKIIEVGLLSPERAGKIYSRLTGQEWVPDKLITLAEIYNRANEQMAASSS